MNDFIIVLIGAIISIIVAYFTSKITYNAEVNKLLHEKRQEVYINLFIKLDELCRNRFLMYDDKYISEIRLLKPSVLLFSSREMIDIVGKIYDSIEDRYNYYMKLFKDECAFNRERGMIDEERINNNYTLEEAKIHVEFIINREEDEYIEKNCLDEKELLGYMKSIIKQMRIDLKVDNILWMDSDKSI